MFSILFASAQHAIQCFTLRAPMSAFLSWTRRSRLTMSSCIHVSTASMPMETPRLRCMPSSGRLTKELALAKVILPLFPLFPFALSPSLPILAVLPSDRDFRGAIRIFAELLDIGLHQELQAQHPHNEDATLFQSHLCGPPEEAYLVADGTASKTCTSLHM